MKSLTATSLKEIPNLKENVVLRDYTTIKVGGVADWFVQVHTLDELVNALGVARKHKVPYLVLGNGANVIVSDSGFAGLVIRNRTGNIAFADRSQVIVDSGVLLAQLILAAASKNLSGLEWLFSIPGSVGGAVYGNAGAHGYSIGSFVRSVTLMRADGKIVRVSPKWMQFEYRSSRLKKVDLSGDKSVILSVKLQLARSKQEDIQARLRQVKEWRIANQPLGEFTAGSMFRNPGAGHAFSSKKMSRNTSWSVIRESKADSLQVGDARVSKKHANFIQNRGKATAKDIRALAEKIRQQVKEKTGIELKEEVEYVGHWE